LAAVAQQQGMTLMRAGEDKIGFTWCLKSADYAKRLRAAYPELNPLEKGLLAMSLYNEACAESVAGHKDKALVSLDDALQSGFQDFDLGTTDKDLDSLRSLAKLKSVVSTGENRLLARLKNELAASKPADFDFSLPSMDGKIVSSKDFAGKVLLLVS